jgi:predicted transcriptional regulator
MPKTTSLKLPDDLKERVGERALGVAQTPHAYMVQAIEEKVVRDERRQEFIASAKEAAAQFKRTGIVYPHKEALAYVRARAGGKKARKPKPVRIPRAER